MPSRTLLWKRGRMVGRRNRSRSTRNRPVTGECITTGQRLGTKLVRALVELLFNDPGGHQDPNGPVAEQLASDPMLRESGGLSAYRNHPRWSSRVHGSKHARHSSEHAVLPNPFHRGGTSKGWRFGRPSCQTLNIMREAVIAEVSTQLSEVVGVIERHLEPTLLAVHLHGSAVDGGLKPHSDIDLLVTVTVRLDETTRRALINDLWKLRLPWRERDSPRCRSHHCCARRHHSVALSS